MWNSSTYTTSLKYKVKNNIGGKTALAETALVETASVETALVDNGQIHLHNIGLYLPDTAISVN